MVIKIIKRIFITFMFFIIATNSFADSFTDAIQDLAVQTACIGSYSMTEVGGGWYDDPHDYYTPQMMAERFAQMSENKTRTITFYGVCFDYAQFAWEDIENYKSWYNEQGMHERQFWIAGVQNDSNEIQLQYPGTRGNHTTIQNGVYVIYPNGGRRNVKTHRMNDGKGPRATGHAWLWVERADGVWFWVDPTWTDTVGYVVYGYIKNGEEVQCRPDRGYCVNYPEHLNSLPLPPAMGSRLSPSKSANSTNREETIKDAAPEWIEGFIREEDDKFMDKKKGKYNDNYVALQVFVDVPVSLFSDNSNIMNKIGFALEIPFLVDKIAGGLGIEYLQNLENENNLYGGLILLTPFGRRLSNNVAWFLGGGVGLRFDVSNKNGIPKKSNLVDSGYFAWKVDTGFIINLSHFFTKVDVSYNNIIGFSMGVGVGFGM